MTKKSGILETLKYELNPLAKGKKWWGRKGIDTASWLLPAIMNIPLKDGGRVRGVGKAKRGFGRAMKKK
jgi:hypothetical protein